MLILNFLRVNNKFLYRVSSHLYFLPIMKEFKTQKFKTNHYIVVYGSKLTDKIYYIISGTVKAKFMGKIRILKSGDFINVISCIINKSAIITAKAMTEVELVVIETSQISLLFKYNFMISKIVQELRLYTLEILKNYASPLIFQKEFTNKEHQSLLLSFSKYLFENREYKRAKYVFEKFKDLYPNTKFQEEMNEYLNELKQDYDLNDSNIENNVYKKDDIIFSQFEKDGKIIFLKKGEVKIFFYTSEYEYFLGCYKAPSIIGQASPNFKFRLVSCVSSSNDTKVLLAPEDSLIKSYKSQNKNLLLTVIKQLSMGIWKGTSILEHSYIFMDEYDIKEKIYDILYTLYQIETGDDNYNLNTYNFGFSIKDIFLSTPRDPFLTLEYFTEVITNSPFLLIDDFEQIVCEDINSLKAFCYKSRRKKEILRQESI